MWSKVRFAGSDAQSERPASGQKRTFENDLANVRFGSQADLGQLAARRWASCLGTKTMTSPDEFGIPGRQVREESA
jgi:hypothetical protein